jgi:hypothetical protein
VCVASIGVSFLCLLAQAVIGEQFQKGYATLQLSFHTFLIIVRLGSHGNFVDAPPAATVAIVEQPTNNIGEKIGSKDFIKTSKKVWGE